MRLAIVGGALAVNGAVLMVGHWFASHSSGPLCRLLALIQRLYFHCVPGAGG